MVASPQQQRGASAAVNETVVTADTSFASPSVDPSALSAANDTVSAISNNFWASQRALRSVGKAIRDTLGSGAKDKLSVSELTNGTSMVWDASARASAVDASMRVLSTPRGNTDAPTQSSNLERVDIASPPAPADVRVRLFGSLGESELGASSRKLPMASAQTQTEAFTPVPSSLAESMPRGGFPTPVSQPSTGVGAVVASKTSRGVPAAATAAVTAAAAA